MKNMKEKLLDIKVETARYDNYTGQKRKKY